MIQKILPIITGAGLLACTAGAAQLFTTPLGSTTSGGSVNASASFDITAAGTLQITLNDLQANPADVGQLISDITFKLSGGQSSGTLSSSSGQQIIVANGGSFTLGSTGATGFGLNNNVSGGLQLTALGFGGPAGLIIGPAGAGGSFSLANGSIAGNNPHNPFINQTATFTLSIPGLTTDETVTGVGFSFGTTPGIEVTANVVP